MKIGTVVFDDPSLAREGWASDGSDAKRINGHGELGSDTLWVTNIPFPKWRDLTLNNTSNILHSQYMRSTIEHIAKELDIIDDVQRMVVETAKIYNKAIKYGYENYGIGIATPGYRYTTIVADKVFPSHMRRTPNVAYRHRLLDAFKQSTQENQAMSNKKIPSGSSVYSFNMPRGSYGKWLLDQPVPIGKSWTEIKMSDSATTIGIRENEMIKGTKAVLEKLLAMGQKNAVFLKVRVTYTSKSHKDFATYASGSNHNRGWVTLPELLTLLKYCVVELHGGFMTELGPLNILTDSMRSEEEHSYSKGIFMENLWIALASPRYKDTYTGVGAYLRAYDRAMCFKVAEKLTLDHGITIGSYGAGRIQAYLREGELEYAIGAGIENYALPQLFMKRGVDSES
jgi:hypothetical protein